MWVVDDDMAACVALSRLLRAAALHVVAMRSARELLEALAHSAPDCLLLDLWLEDANGLDLLPAVRSPVRLVLGALTPVGDGAGD